VECGIFSAELRKTFWILKGGIFFAELKMRKFLIKFEKICGISQFFKNENLWTLFFIMKKFRNFSANFIKNLTVREIPHF